MISFLVIAFAMLLLGIRLRLLRNNLRRTGNTKATFANEILQEVLLLFFGGLIILLVVNLSTLLSSEARISTDAGVAMMTLGFLSFIQFLVQWRKVNEHHVDILARVAVYIGLGFFIVYVILRVIGIQF